MPRTTPADRWWLAGICILGLVLRCLNLNSGLWYDEILTVVEFIRLPVSELTSTYTSLNNHVFFSLQAHAAVALFGEHPWVLRLPAVLFGVAGIVAIWALARPASHPWEARISALLLAVSYHHIWFSQNARGYSGLVFWCLLATLLFVRHYENPKLKPWLWYAATVAAAGYTHLTAAFVFAAHGLTFIVLHFLRKRSSPAAPRASGFPRPLLGLALGGLFTVLLHAPMIPQMVGTFSKVTATAPRASSTAPGEVGPSDAQKGAAVPTGDTANTPKPEATPHRTSPAGAEEKTNWKSPLWTVMEVIRSLGGFGSPIVLAMPLALLLLGVGALSLLRRDPVLVWVHAIQIPLTLAVLLVAGMRIWPRYFLVDIGFILICLTRGIFATTEFLVERFAWHKTRFGDAEKLAIGAGIVAAAASLTLLPKNYRAPKQDYGGAMVYVNRERQAGDSVAVVGLANLPYEIYYKPGWTRVNTLAELETLRQREGSTWIVYSFPSHARNNFPEIMKRVQEEFETVRVFEGSLGDGDVTVRRSSR
jgi:mannosyltransferase